ncbi:MAG: acylphosphatase [Acidobacteriota bacterium]
MKDARRWWVSGRVQGVAFRWHTRQKAIELGLVGTVQNLADGRVEAAAAGEPADLEALGAWLAEGPPMAQVTSVESRTPDRGDSTRLSTLPDFRIVRT